MSDWDWRVVVSWAATFLGVLLSISIYLGRIAKALEVLAGIK